MSSAHSRHKTLSEHSSLKKNCTTLQQLPGLRHSHGEHIAADKKVLGPQIFKPQPSKVNQNCLVCQLTSKLPLNKTQITSRIIITQTHYPHH